MVWLPFQKFEYHSEGTLSPIVFTIYTADLDQWVKSSHVYNYSDDTSSSVAHKHLETLLKLLETDADAILSFMASNGLIANQKKTFFMLLNYKPKKGDEDHKVSIRVDSEIIERERSTKLLGMTIEDNQCWKENFSGKSGLISSLNKRLFAFQKSGQLSTKKQTDSTGSCTMDVQA